MGEPNINRCNSYSTVPPPKSIEKSVAQNVLDSEHLGVFGRAIYNILSTSISETTFAQIVDGMPLADVAFSTVGHRHTIHDPIFQHRTLCPGVLEKTRSLRAQFDADLIEISTDVN